MTQIWVSISEICINTHTKYISSIWAECIHSKSKHSALHPLISLHERSRREFPDSYHMLSFTSYFWYFLSYPWYSFVFFVCIFIRWITVYCWNVYRPNRLSLKCITCSNMYTDYWRVSFGSFAFPLLCSVSLSVPFFLSLFYYSHLLSPISSTLKFKLELKMWYISCLLLFGFSLKIYICKT